jgi:hypothetical protein
MKMLNDLMKNRAVSQRDKFLKEAFARVPGRSLHLRVIDFGRAITRFETTFQRTSGALPRKLTPFTEALFKARTANCGPLPTDEYELAKILLEKDSGQ